MLWATLPEGTILSTVRGHRFALSAWPPQSTRNSFAPVFYGTVRPTPSGSLITGRFLMHPVTMVFLVAWFGGALFGLIVALFLVSPRPEHAGASGSPALVPVAWTAGVVVCGWLIVRLGIRFGRGQRQAIDGYLRSVLEAR